MHQKNYFKKFHEASWFAEIINQRGKELECAVGGSQSNNSARTNSQVSVNRTLENFKVQTASLPLVGIL